MRLLLVENDEPLHFHLRFGLERENMAVDSCFDGEDALCHLREKKYDFILLDRMLPRMDGLSVLRALRRDDCDTPVLLLAAPGEFSGCVNYPDMGGCDCLIKPFEFAELMTKIHAFTGRADCLKPAESLHYGDIIYYVAEHRLQGKQKACVPSKKEGQLLELFLRASEQVLSRSLLLSNVWGPESDVEDGNLDNYIHFVRQRIRSVDSRVQICTLRGVGYRLTFDCPGHTGISHL